MSKTDKTKPLWVQINEYPIAHDHHLGECRIAWRSSGGWRHNYDPWALCEPETEWWKTGRSNRDRGIGPKHAKWAKRMRSKKNRRREIPHEKMRGYGWGEENYKLNW